jgi:mRNA-degrading endonuclease toxin of MazEF toxin-antitoxin module
MTPAPLRGNLYNVPDWGNVIVVSNNSRNQYHRSVLVCPILGPGALPEQSTVVQLGDAEPVQGSVMADFIFGLPIERLGRGTLLGPASAEAVLAVNAALIDALALI